MVHFRAVVITALLATIVAAIAGVAGYARAADRALVLAQATPAPAKAPAALASGEYFANPDLRCDILEVKRVSGNAVLVRFMLASTATSGNAIQWRFSWQDNYLIDPAENKKYSILTDASNNYIAEIRDTNFNPADKRVFWAKFPAPPVSSNKVSVTIAGFSPFDDIPVGR